MAKTKETKGFYTVEQVADKLKLHWQTVLDYIRGGELKAMRLGKGYRIPVVSFEEFVAERMADVSLSAIASSERFSAKPKDGKHKRYRSILIVPVAQGEVLIPSNPENDRTILNIVKNNANVLDPKPDVDGLVDKRELKSNGREIYFRTTESGIIFLRESLGEPEGEVYIRHLLSVNFHILKIAHDTYKKFNLDTPVFVKFRMEGIENDLLKTGSFRRDLSIEDRSVESHMEIDEGPVKLKTEKVADLTIKIVLRVLRGFGNNRLTVDILKDFLKNIVEGKE